jgi:hypothetical protein
MQVYHTDMRACLYNYSNQQTFTERLKAFLNRGKKTCVNHMTAVSVLYFIPKAVPLHAMEAHGERGGIAPTHT